MEINQEVLEDTGEKLGNQEAVDASQNEGVKIEGEQTSQPSKWETAARASGWVPLEEWEGDPDDHVDAKEFVRRGELFHKISSQSSEIKDLKKAIGSLMEHHQKVKETEFTRALEYLKQQKKSALEEGDADKLLAVDEAIDTLKQEKQAESAAPKQQQQAGPTQTFVSWVQQNAWYLKDPELRAFADDVGVGAFQRAGGNIAEAELYEMVKRRVMKAFPERFKGTGNKSAPSVEGASGSTRPSKSDTFKLSEQEEKVCKTFVRQGIMTRQQYIDELKRANGVS